MKKILHAPPAAACPALPAFYRPATITIASYERESVLVALEVTLALIEGNAAGARFLIKRGYDGDLHQDLDKLADRLFAARVR